MPLSTIIGGKSTNKVWSNEEFDQLIVELKQMRNESLPGISRILHLMLFMKYGMQKYFPSYKLRRQLVRIKNDRYYIKRSALEEAILPKEWKLILGRFWLFSIVKCLTNYMNKYYKSENKKYNNIIIERFFFLKVLGDIYGNIEEYASVTFNSRNNKGIKNTSIPSPTLLIESHIEEIKEHQNLLGKMRATRKRINELSSYENLSDDEYAEILLGFDLIALQKLIFYGMFDDINISKKFGGKQSQRYKADLFVGLFKNTHPEMFYDEALLNGANIDKLNLDSVFKIIYKY